MIAADPEYQALLALSARLGRDPLLVQGAGGNTSIKRDGVVWVKASGTWLMQADTRPIMVPVRIAPLLDALDTDAAEQAASFVVEALNPGGLRPSIETTMHAALPQPVVIHVHCVETMAWAAQRGTERLIAPLLVGLDWRFVPYVRPGPPLTRAMLQAGAASVYILGNHGLVVAAESVAAASSLLRDVQSRLRRPVRPAPAPDQARLDRLATAEWAPSGDPESHGAGTDPVSAALAPSGSFYPDHVIFLGPRAMVLRPEDSIADAQARRVCDGFLPPPLALVPGAGAMIRRDASPGALALARCLGDVLARLRAVDDLLPLSPAQEAELMNWDAEAYRRALDTTVAE